MCNLLPLPNLPSEEDLYLSDDEYDCMYCINQYLIDRFGLIEAVKILENYRKDENGW